MTENVHGRKWLDTYSEVESPVPVLLRVFREAVNVTLYPDVNCPKLKILHSVNIAGSGSL